MSLSATNNNRPVQPYKGIAKKLITRTILFSSVITLIITAFNLYERYNYDISLIDSRLDQISNVHLSSLSNNLWLADKPELQVHLNGILKIPDIQYLEVYNEDELWAFAGTKKNKNVKPRIYNMIYTYKGKELNIGTLKVEADLEKVYQNIYQELWLTLGTNGAKTFLVAFFMFFLFHNLVIRHLHKIAEDVDQFDIKKPDSKLKLDRKDNPANNKDEFDLVLNAFDKLQKDLRLSFSSIEDQVKHRTKELQEAQTQLLSKERLSTLGQLTATVSHELRNPLGAMRPSLYILKKRLGEDVDETALAAYTRIDRNIDRCDQIIDELLDFTRINVLDKQLTQVNEWLETVIMEQDIPPGIQVEENYCMEELKLSIDPGRLSRAIINVVVNACQAMQDLSGEVRKGSTLSIDTGVKGERVEIVFTDTGVGIPKEGLEKIFEPLYSTKSFGVGLGMPAIKQIMEQHGGGIKVDSKGDKGTTVILWLPMKDSEGEVLASK